MKTNYHSHSTFCDGAASLERMVEGAIEKKFNILGFSSHAPLKGQEDWTLHRDKFHSYIEEIEGLQSLYKTKITLCKGIELDYIEGEYPWVIQEGLQNNLDYLIGSVHMMKSPLDGEIYSIDGPLDEMDYMLNRVFEGRGDALVKEYYRLVNELVEENYYDFIGHLDVIRKHNKKRPFFDEKAPWYRRLVCETLDHIKGAKRMIEVNTGGLSRQKTDSLYPDNIFLKECAKRNIPLVINSDAHRPEHLDFYLKEARVLVKEAGYGAVYYFDKGSWQEETLL